MSTGFGAPDRVGRTVPGRAATRRRAARRAAAALLWDVVTWRDLPEPDGRPPRKVGEALDPVLRRIGGGSGQVTAAVVRGWEGAVGQAIAAHAQPLSLRGTTLVVGVDAPAYATQLRLMTPQLLARLTELVGKGAVEAVDVRVRA
jgi:predicted nucleic acid-binding Zn ribbon protein